MDPKTTSTSPARSQVVHFKQLRTWKLYKPDPLIPEEALQAIIPPIYLLMGPPALTGVGDGAIVAPRNLVMGIYECPPGEKCPLHVHTATTEVFMCLRGRLRVRTRDEAGEAEADLEVHDVISVPPGVYRDFVNVTAEPALMLAMSIGDDGAFEEDLVVHPEESRAYAARFGEDALRRLEVATGYRFPTGGEPGAA